MTKKHVFIDIELKIQGVVYEIMIFYFRHPIY
jgi:hypothetical protein